jgi:hypothetical protein
VDPPARTRIRLFSRATAGRAATSSRILVAGWVSAAALLVAAVMLTGYAASLRQRVGDLEAALRLTIGRLDRVELQVATSQRVVEGTQMRMAVLTAPDLTEVALKGQGPSPGAAGRALWSRGRGLVFDASALPQLPAGRTYQLWYLTASAPVSAGLLKPDSGGRATAEFSTPSALASQPVGFAVSLEPEGGVPAPTGAIYLAGTAH